MSQNGRANALVAGYPLAQIPVFIAERAGSWADYVCYIRHVIEELQAKRVAADAREDMILEKAIAQLDDRCKQVPNGLYYMG